MDSRKRAALGLSILLVVALAIAGCSSGELDTLLGGGSHVSNIPAFLIASDFNGLNLHSYKVDPTTGALTEVAGSPFPTSVPGDGPWAVAVTPDGKFAYLGDQGGPSIEIWAINTTTGALTSNGIVTLPGNNVEWVSSISITPDGKYLYVPDQVGLNGYSINATTGALTVLPGFPMTLGSDPFASAMDPLGRFLYVNDNSDMTVYAFSINSSTGALTTVAGSPFPCIMTSCEGLVVDGLGKFVYASSQGDQAVQGWKMGSNGALTSVGPSVGANPTPFQVLADPSGKYVYSMDDGGPWYNGYTINATTGALTAIGSANPFTASGEPQGGAIDPSGKFLYASDCDNDKVAANVIGAGGALTPVPGQPFAANGGSNCGGIAVTRK